MSAKRILVTGSRHWTDVETIEKALFKWYLHLSQGGSEVVLVHGACHGADIIARDIWLSHGLQDEPHPADWKTYGKAAGFIRNGVMVDLDADVCLGFPLPDSRGTYDCLAKARTAGIFIETFRPKEDA